MLIAADEVLMLSLPFLMKKYETITVAMRDHTALPAGRLRATDDGLTRLARHGSTAQCVALALLSRCVT